jgi:hypothetical protein
MNWDAIGAIAELLGAIGVIASLVYLATQIRQSREQMSQNTRAMRAGSYQHFFDSWGQSVTRGMDNPERERAIRLGMLDYTNLSEEDAFRFNVWMNGVIQAQDNAHYQYRVGMLDEERWQKHYGDLRSLFRSSPGVREWWKASTMRPTMSLEFVALVEEILGEEAEAATSATNR